MRLKNPFFDGDSMADMIRAMREPVYRSEPAKIPTVRLCDEDRARLDGLGAKLDRLLASMEGKGEP